MEWTEADTDLLERYAQGELSPEEREALERRIVADPEFAAEARLTAEALSALKAEAKAADKAKLAAIWQSVGSEEVHYRELQWWKKRNFLPIAAAILLLAVVGAVFLFRQTSPSPKSIFEELYKPFPAEPLVRKRNPDYDEGMRRYRNGDYEAAAGHFRRPIGVDSLDASRHLYLGNCALVLEDFNSAMVSFDSTALLGGPAHMDHVDWYRALTRLRMGEVALAKTMFEKIASEGGPYAASAREALEELE